MAEQTDTERCGICDHPRAGHGIRYAAVVGEHHWAPAASLMRVDEPGTLTESAMLEQIMRQQGVW